MRVAEMDSVTKMTLKSLCISNGWSYGLSWRFDQRNSMLLTLEDAYYGEEMGAIVDNMLLQFHMLGEGIIGQAAYTGKHRWIFSDAHGGEGTLTGSAGGQDTSQDDSEMRCQFSTGIKTIAVVPVETKGVVQFGSVQKISESLEFLNQTKTLFQEMGNADGSIPLEYAPSSLTNEADDLNELFASLISSGSLCNGTVTPVNVGSSSILFQSPTFLSESHQERPILDTEELSHHCDEFGMDNLEAQVIFNESTISANSSAAYISCISTWSNEGSILTFFDPPLPSEKRIQAELSVNSIYSTGDLVDTQKTIQGPLTKVVGSRSSAELVLAPDSELQERSTILPSLPEEYKPAAFPTNLSTSYAMDALSQWLASPEHGTSGMGITTNNNLSQSMGVFSVSSGLEWGDILMDLPIEHPPNSVQSSITTAFTSDGQEKSLIADDAQKHLFKGLEPDFWCGQDSDFWKEFLMPHACPNQSAISTGISGCISELDVGSAGPRKGLFSELGLEKLLQGVTSSSCVTNCSFEDQSSITKRRKTESSSSTSDRVHFTSLSSSGGSMNWMQPVCNLEKPNNLVAKTDVLRKSQVGLWIDDGYSVNVGNDVATKPKKPEEPVKVTRKRARPGQSTRPRPKDRQMIQDRLQELKGIIPNGGKMSIDSLLDQTIKYMLFLQSVTKYAEKVKEVDEPKENGIVLKDDGNVGSTGPGGGATWAFEVGGQTMVCPILIKDLSQPGQKLIEMLCEDRGFFLEIADIIRGFEFNILKGEMEVRGDKLWARFVVEESNKESKHVTRPTRLEILESLLKHTQLMGTRGIDSRNQLPSDLINDGIPQLNYHQQPLLSFPISVAETLK